MIICDPVRSVEEERCMVAASGKLSRRRTKAHVRNLRTVGPALAQRFQAGDAPSNHGTTR